MIDKAGDTPIINPAHFGIGQAELPKTARNKENDHIREEIFESLIWPRRAEFARKLSLAKDIWKPRWITERGGLEEEQIGLPIDAARVAKALDYLNGITLPSGLDCMERLARSYGTECFDLTTVRVPIFSTASHEPEYIERTIMHTRNGPPGLIFDPDHDSQILVVDQNPLADKTGKALANLTWEEIVNKVLISGSRAVLATHQASDNKLVKIYPYRDTMEGSMTSSHATTIGLIMREIQVKVAQDLQLQYTHKHTDEAWLQKYFRFRQKTLDN